MQKKWLPMTVYSVCMAIISVSILLLLYGHFRPNKAHFTSVHPAGTIPTLWGFAADSIVNSGDAKELDTLPGVGAVISQRIIETRELIHGFRIPADLMLVKGIGEKTLEKIMNALEEPLVQLEELNE